MTLEELGSKFGELDRFAGKLDTLHNVDCWYRNPDKGGFSLQGYWKAKFNPDLIAFTRGDKVAVLEYKGEDRVSNEDIPNTRRSWAAIERLWTPNAVTSRWSLRTTCRPG